MKTPPLQKPIFGIYKCHGSAYIFKYIYIIPILLKMCQKDIILSYKNQVLLIKSIIAFYIMLMRAKDCHI